ncbi:adenylate/guanylate cyclase domain-containing protein [Marinovum sp. KMM 9879]
MQVEDWLQSHGLAKYAARFAEHDIGLDILGSLTDEDLREIGLPLGARKRVLQAIAGMNAADPVAPNAPRAVAAGGPAQYAGERRHITVLFCDLVDFTGLATAMDPEDLEALIARFVETCRSVVDRWGGHVGNYLGDGVLVYFGWPRAFEDAPQRAAHASLALVKAVQRIKAPTGRPLEVRVGMASGLVLAGRTLESGSGQLETVFGKTPNLAARLEQLASPGQVMICSATSALLPAPRFAQVNLGVHAVKGFASPVGVWRLENASLQTPGHGRIARLGEAPIEGRARPLARLEGWWHEAGSGQGMRLVSLVGEAGIGKSHTTAHFLRICRAAGGQDFELQCWPFNDNATLYPFVAWFCERAGVRPDAPRGVRRAAFAAMAAANGVPREVYFDSLGDLLDLEPAPVGQNADLRRATWFGAIAKDLRALCARAPTLLVMEDMHWTDPLTEQLLGTLIETCRDLPLMILATSRPHFTPAWSAGAGARKLELTRLARTAAERMVKHLAADLPLTPTVREKIVEASDGVPLFVAELTRDVIKRAAEGSEDAATIEIPATLQGVLSARLESAGEARSVAQAASCIGRVFDRDLVARVTGLDPADLTARIEALERLALIEPLDDSEARYIFRHALIQESAYQSQPRSRRRAIHGDIADEIALRPGNDARHLAHHMTAAERFDTAITQWKVAGDRAMQRSALGEAVDLYRRGLSLVAKLPVGTARDARHLSMLLALGPVLSAHDGYGSESVGSLYAEAAPLADALGHVSDRFAVRRGLWMYRQMSAQYVAAEDVAQDMMTLASESDNETDKAVEANRALGATAFMRGKLRLARHHLEAAIAGYARGAGADNTERYGDDPGLGCMAYLSSAHWYLGDVDASRQCCAEMLALARKLEHPFSMARSLTFSAFTYHLMQDFDRLIPTAQEAAAHADRYEFPFHAGVGRILGGWGLCRMGDHDQGRAYIDAGFSSYGASGSQMLLPLYLSLRAGLADECAAPEEAWYYSEQAMTALAKSQEDLVKPEVLRVHGELMVKRGQHSEGFAHLDRAIALAQEQGSVFCHLRALSAACRLGAEYTDALAKAVAQFPQSTTSPDLDAACEILKKVG